MPRWLIWLSIMAAVVVGGEALLAILAARATPVPDPRYALDFAFGVRLPVRVINDVSGGWQLLTVFWIVIAGMAVAGHFLSRAIEDDERVGVFALVAAMALIGVALTFFPITFAGDPYAYVAFGRLYGLHQLNPYHLVNPIDAASDPSLAQCLRFYGNPPVGDNYGPLWTLFAGAVARIEASASLAVQVWTHRAAALTAVVVAAIGLFKLARRSGAKSWKRGVAAFAFHPVVLYETAAGAHNDSIMLAFAVWAFAIATEYPLLAGLLLGAGCAIKYVAVVAAPFLAARIWRASGATPAILALAIAAAVVVISFFPFWVGPVTLRSLLNETAGSRSSLTWLVDLPIYFHGLADAHVIAALTPLALVTLAAATTLAIVVLWSLVRFLRTGATGEMWRAVAATIYALPSIYPWYTLWIAPALAKSNAWSVFAYWLGLLSFLHYAQDAPRQPSGAGYAIGLETMIALTVVSLAVPVVAAIVWSRQNEPTPASAAESPAASS